MQKIMLVDDEEIFQYLTKSMLDDVYEVVCASSGEEALSLYEEEKPDLVITDIMMPNMSGLELLENFKTKYGEGRVPMIFLTSDERDEQEIAGLRSGAVDYMHKPCQKDILQSRIGHILDNIEHMEDLKEEAINDPLTGLLNKAYTEKEMTENCKRCNGSLMLIDLDSFKEVNDLAGHDTGDKLLVKFADILREVFRSRDTIGRIGGDEFVVFCNYIHDRIIIDAKVGHINNLLKQAASEILGDHKDIPLSVSVGVVYVPDEGKDYPELYKLAEAELHKMKENGKGGASILGGDNPVPESSVSMSISERRAMLEEKDEPQGAYETGYENFREIYRFLVRSVKNYGIGVEFGVITLKADNDADISEAVVDAYNNMLSRSLRKSDVFIRQGTKGFMVLLPESGGGESIDNVIGRIMHNWSEVPLSEGIEAVYEFEKLQ